MSLTVQQAIDQLGDRSSAKRRAAAKRLRTLADPAAGAALLTALQSEVTDPRTWETHYQLIMALGECRYEPAIALLSDLVGRPTNTEMVGTALGDALTRIEWATSRTLDFVDRAMTEGSPGVADGAFRALAMMRVVPPDDLVGRLLAFADRLEPYDLLQFWIVVAAAGWSGNGVDAFLRRRLTSPNTDIAKAAAESLAKSYGDYPPL